MTSGVSKHGHVQKKSHAGFEIKVVIATRERAGSLRVAELLGSHELPADPPKIDLSESAPLTASIRAS